MPAEQPDQRAVERPLRVTFIVRMWREPAQAGALDWRGTVEHVQAGERRGFQGADGLSRLLDTWLDLTGKE